ncbi:phage holin family protein [Vagococcus entomophilus]|uniref:Phage holin family protein n=1 Tax=Vagococcus entomophilus TaxID=1160095 RepID=A0A430AJF2_9ENTE|nr:phage holin family protein [Vagococcus entomophilus]RSU08143.1 hypothetical protein CBF30_02550 [Vagococcus entomophilus]
MSYFKRLVVNTLTFISLAVVLPNDMFYVSSFFSAILASFVLSILNMFVGPILHILSFPITLITFGLFSFVINAIILELTSYFVGSYSFGFSGFGSALLVALIMSFVNTVVRDHELSKIT